MSKIRIYLEPDTIGPLITVKEPDAVHKLTRVLRLTEQDVVYIFDGAGCEYRYRIEKIQKNALSLKKERRERKQEKPKNKLTLGFPLLREEKVDFILQKATELGAAAFVPFICRRSLQRIPPGKKLTRWRKIIIEAARQSGRLWLPCIEAVSSLDKVSQEPFALKLAASIKGESMEPAAVKEREEVFIIVGPEGDFSADEEALLADSGFEFVKLSDNILRTETTAVFATGLISYLQADSV